MNRDRGRTLVAAAVLAATAILIGVSLRPTTAPPPQSAPVAPAPVGPRVYWIMLSGGRSLGVYLDPGRAGPNGLHGTFTDAQGRELDLAQAPAVAATGPGGRRVSLAVLREGPGHFYSDGDFAAGTWNLAIEVTTRAGERLRVRLGVTL